MWRFLKVARRIERSTLSVVIRVHVRGDYVVSHFLAYWYMYYPSRHVYPCIGAAVWIWYSDWHRRVSQPSCCFHPASKWPMALARSTLDNFTIFTYQHVKSFLQPLEHGVQNCTIWLTVSNNWVHWWPVLPVSCWHWVILANFCWTPPPFSGLYFSLWSWYWDTISGIWKGIPRPPPPPSKKMRTYFLQWC